MEKQRRRGERLAPTNSSRRRFQFTLASGGSQQFASHSDDGISIFVTEYNRKGEKLGTRRIMNNFRKEMAFPNTKQSYHDADHAYLDSDCSYLVTVEYINTFYTGDKDLDGLSLYIYSLPVEILDKDKKVTTKLKVAKMAETGVLTGTGSTATLNIDKDSDRFYVRVKGVGPVQGEFTIKVATIENPDAATYNGGETVIDMERVGLDWISKQPMLLVSDKVDDEHNMPAGVKDRTHKIQLSGKF